MLTPRELDVARLVLACKSNKQIAHELGIKVGTVKAMMYNIFRKLEITNRVALVVYMYKLPPTHITTGGNNESS